MVGVKRRVIGLGPSTRYRHRRHNGMCAAMRLLVLTRIFPNGQTPLLHAPIRRQCEALARHCELTILATVPWFPGATLLRRLRYSDVDISQIARKEVLYDLEVSHPRALYLPKVLAPSGLLYVASLAAEVFRNRGRADAILSTWAYPDGFAAVLLGKALGIPVFVQLIGSDMDVIAKVPSVSAQLRLIFPRAQGVLAVSSSLAASAVALGARAERMLTLCTGVDRTMFAPRPKQPAREQLGLSNDDRILLFVGRISHDKGATDALKGFERIAERHPTSKLVFVGDGPELAELRSSPLHAAKRVLALGALPGEQVAEWMTAADVITLPSYHEGTPNVLLEALSCGRPVVGTRVGGIPDLVSDARYGELVEPGDIEGLGSAFEKVLFGDYPVAELTSSPSLMSWDEHAKRLLAFIADKSKPSL